MKHLSHSFLASIGLLTLATGCQSSLPAAVQSPDSQGYGYGGGAAVARQAWGSQNNSNQVGWGQPAAQTNGWGSQANDPMAAWGTNNPNASAQPNAWPAGSQPNAALQPQRPNGSTQWTPGLQAGQTTQARQQAWSNSVPESNYGQGQDAYSGYAEGAESLDADLPSVWDQGNGYGAAGSPNPTMNSYEPGVVGNVDPNRRSMGNGAHTGAQLFDELQEVRGERDQLMSEVQFLSQALIEAQNQLLSSEQSANRGGQELQFLQGQVVQLEQQLAQARKDNENLAARLYQAQIGRLKAERTLLEDRIGEHSPQGNIALQPGQANASQPSPSSAGFGEPSTGEALPTINARTQPMTPAGSMPTRAQASPFARPNAGFEGQGAQQSQSAGNAGVPSQIPPPSGAQGGGR